MRSPYFLDIEASSLSAESYPIEIGWANETSGVTAHLISPADVPTWTDWDERSEQIHGIPRALLLEGGRSPQFVCDELLRHLTGEVMYSDNADFDSLWLVRLFQDCGRPIPNFDIRPMQTLYQELIAANVEIRLLRLSALTTIRSQARKNVGGRHRAGVDAEYLLESWRLIKAYVMEHTVDDPMGHADVEMRANI